MMTRPEEGSKSASRGSAVAQGAIRMKEAGARSEDAAEVPPTNGTRAITRTIVNARNRRNLQNLQITGCPVMEMT